MADNPFLDEDETELPGSDGDSTNFKQLRDYAKKLERERNALQKKVEPLEAYKAQIETEKKQASVSQVFESVGLAAKHATLFLKINPDGEVTPDSVAAFAEEYELPRQTALEIPDPDAGGTVAPDWSQEQIVQIKPETKSTGFAPTDGAQAPSAKVITELAEAEALSVSNPEEYARLRQAGRIKLAKLPGSAA